MNKANLDFAIRSQGYFTISTDKRGVLSEFPNLIVNNGLDMLAKTSAYVSNCFVGRGSSIPVETDTDLESYAATKDSPTYLALTCTSTPPYYAYVRKAFSFPAGTVTGNITEVGIGRMNGVVRDLFCRSLIKDSFGNPTTITLLPDEILQVTYELRHYMPVGDTTGSITLTGNIGGTYNYVLRPANVTTPSSGTNGWSAEMDYRYSYYYNSYAYSTAIGPITGKPSGATYTSSSSSAAPYINGSYTASVTYVWGLSDGNVPGGIRSIAFLFGAGLYQVEFTPPIPKTSTDTLSLTFNNTWARKP